MNMRFLYNADRRLFSIGYNVTEGRLDHAYYDLLASEARLGSFVAIARGDIPIEHWFAMSRPYGAVGRRQVLLSWTGTMFEYLMPLLFQRSYGNSLLDKATREAVAIQIAYGRKHHVPWGISESASGDLDIQQDLSVPCIWRAGTRTQARPRGEDRHRALCHPAGDKHRTAGSLRNLRRLADWDC